MIKKVLLKSDSTSITDLIERLLFMITLTSFFVFCHPISSLSITKIDSLKRELQNTSLTDTARVELFGEIGRYYFNQANDSCILYATKAINLASSINYLNGQGRAYNMIGNYYNAKGDYQLALKNFHLSYNTFDRMEGNNSYMMSNLTNSIGNTYLGMKEIDKALDAYQTSYTIAVQDSISYMIGISSFGIGNILMRKGEIDQALDYYFTSLNQFKAENQLYHLALIYSALGTAFTEKGNFDVAFTYFENSVLLLKDIDNEYGIAGVYELISGAYEKKKEYSNALEYAKKAFTIFHGRNAYDNLQKISLNISDLFKTTGSIDSAYHYLGLHMQFKDSVYNTEKNRELLNLEAQFENEKKQKKIALMEKEKELFDSEKRQQRLIIISISIVAVLILLFLSLTLNRVRMIKKQKNVIEKQKSEVQQQKEIVEHKNTEILDSIVYAKRLQDAILPSNKIVTSYLLDSFIIYKPKDIIAGDFYFMDIIEEGNKKLVYYVAADSTGHGVPGAMLSIVGANGLKRCIQEFGLRKPGEILDKLSILVAESFSQSEEQIRDGMDLALCCLEMEDNYYSKVHYAGANNPLWIINPARTSWPEFALPFSIGHGAEIKANKQAIGFTENSKPFTTFTIEIQSGDTLYTFSDGFSDQFGGLTPEARKEGGKKFKSANFKKLLVSLYDKDLYEQKETINETFEVWKGNFEQVDDVCIIGVRLEMAP